MKGEGFPSRLVL